MKGFLLTALLAPIAFAESEFRSLFNGKDLSGWSPILQNALPGKDPQGFITVHEGNIHMYKDSPNRSLVPFGVIISDESFSRFHLRFQYKWLDKKFAPRQNSIRDAGLLYHTFEADRVWPKSIENQVQEGDTGDLIWVRSQGLTWMRPAGEHSPDSQGQAGLLPEWGGNLRFFNNHDYIGRFGELDNYHGWTTVDTIVQADEWAIHKINGKTCVRLRDFKDEKGNPLTEGRLCLQLEGAEILYRNIEIRTLEAPLGTSHDSILLDALHGQTHSQEITINNPGEAEQWVRAQLTGKDIPFFTITPLAQKIAPGQEATFKVTFAPKGFGGRYSAGIQFGPEDTGAFVTLNAIGYGEETEPKLQEIIDVLGIPARAADGRWLDHKASRIGSSINARTFLPYKGKKFYLASVASFPDEGDLPAALTFFTEADPELQDLSILQPAPGFDPNLIALLQTPAVEPETVDGAEDQPKSPNLFPEPFIEIKAPDSALGLSLGNNSSTDSDRASALKLNYKARIFKASRTIERQFPNSYLICFETGGIPDYNDAIYLLGNAQPWRLPDKNPSKEQKRFTLSEIQKALKEEE